MLSKLEKYFTVSIALLADLVRAVGPFLS